jgi:hypothetical protein
MPPADHNASSYIHGSDADEQRRLEAQALLLGGADFLRAQGDKGSSTRRAI